MKCVILAGGRGSRLSEETDVKPKPMVTIGDRPIIWHIMKIYAAHGINEFVVCLGYRGYVMKEYFANYYLHESDITVDMKDNRIHFHDSNAEPWKVTLVNTGDDTMTGGRLLRVRDYLDAEPFCLTYGDGLADVDVGKEIQFHRGHGKLVTMTVVRPSARFGNVVLDGRAVSRFEEKPQASSGYINGGFFVVEPDALDYIEGDLTSWERSPLEGLAADGQVAAWKHDGFWQPMDTLREKRYLDDLWSRGEAQWKRW